MVKSVDIGDPGPRFEEILDRLTEKSREDYYNPYQLFSWPDALPMDQPWMSPELMSVHGTDVEVSLSSEQLLHLSKWESINFYSLNVHGIRELLREMVSRIHTSGFEVASEYFHHVIGEENEHMWFFAKFCLKYGGKIYPNKQLAYPSAPGEVAGNFLVFAHLLIFEEIVDFFNSRMAKDRRLHPTIRQINAIHHQDESRHIAFGRQLVAHLFRRLREELSASEIDELRGHIRDYLNVSIDSLCNPAAYRDAGIRQPYDIRRSVLNDPAYVDRRAEILERTEAFLVRIGALAEKGVVPT